jgi:hypothetical protein
MDPIRCPETSIRTYQYSMRNDPEERSFNLMILPVLGFILAICLLLKRPLPDKTQHSQQRDIHASDGIRTHNISRRAATAGTGGENLYETIE